MADSKVRVSSTLYEQLRQLADKSGKSMKELVDEAIQAYLFGQVGVEGKEIKGITAKIIPLQYPAKCKRCGRQLEAGELAYWVRITYNDNTVRSFIYCLDCYYKGSALKEHYLKKKQLEIIIKELKKEADELSRQVLELRKEADYYKLARQIRELIKEAYEYLDYVTNPEKQEALEKFISFLSKLEDFVSSLDKVEGVSYEPKPMVRRERQRRAPRRKY